MHVANQSVCRLLTSAALALLAVLLPPGMALAAERGPGEGTRPLTRPAEVCSAETPMRMFGIRGVVLKGGRERIWLSSDLSFSIDGLPVYRAGGGRVKAVQAGDFVAFYPSRGKPEFVCVLPRSMAPEEAARPAARPAPARSGGGDLRLENGVWTN